VTDLGNISTQHAVTWAHMVNTSLPDILSVYYS